MILVTMCDNTEENNTNTDENNTNTDENNTNVINKAKLDFRRN